MAGKLKSVHFMRCIHYISCSNQYSVTFCNSGGWVTENFSLFFMPIHVLFTISVLAAGCGTKSFLFGCYNMTKVPILNTDPIIYVCVWGNRATLQSPFNKHILSGSGGIVLVIAYHCCINIGEQ